MKFKTKDRAKSNAALPGTLVPLLIALIGLALAAGLIWLALFAQSNDRYRDDLAQAYATQQLGALNQTTTQLRNDLARLAANPQLQVALQQGGSTSVQRMLRYYLADNQSMRIFAVGEAESRADGQEVPSFAVLDMIRRAERNMPVPMEAHPVDGTWQLHIVTPLRVSDNAPIGGTLVAAFDLQRVLAAMPPLEADAGQLKLVQSFPGGPEQTLYQSGSGFGETITQPLNNPAWRIEFQPGAALVAGVANPLLLLGSAILALFGIIAALWWLHRCWTADVKSDASVLSQLAQGHKVAGLRLGPMRPVGQEIMQLASGHGRKLGPSPKREDEESQRGKKAPAPSTPALSDDEILDIDIVDSMDDLGNDIFATGSVTSETPAIPEVPAEIFRAYDIRGVVDRTLTAETVYWLGRAIGSESIAHGETNVAVARDGRLSGPVLVEQLIRGLMESGCQVIDLGMVPTPVLYYATHTTQAKSGVMLTGSHNPADYNGLKVVIAGETLADQRIQALHQRLRDNDLSEGSGGREQLELLGAYRRQIAEDVVLVRSLKVVIDCGNGVAGVVAQGLLEDLGCEVIPLYCEVDGNFPNHHPDPGHIENLQDLIAEVKRSEADIGIAFDGDGDRLGVITRSGELIYPDRLMMLFAEDIVTRHPGADIVFDVKCTRRLPALISRMGGRPVMWKSGHSMIKAKMVETGALLGGEMSGHLFFKERWFGFDDGLYSACRLLELISIQPPEDNPEKDIFSKYPAGLVTPEINLKVGEQRKFELIEALKKQADWGTGRVSTLDGIRVDFPHGWGLIRASNTTPMLVLRFEADKPDELERIQQLFRDKLANIAGDLQLTF
ncbi:phosphomannomutase/phosphoglucomutase [uncultured Halopseudomonas sp.]|uniref:phosphomannomutase/phosphoglucomutase n=1 Tax=uncultured Halopseudomonas sp. TaxID=2901193 RepID=UPI0030EF6AB7|tara:strand:- start:41297 stop:43819 length:2523 start_codon:yes stop_codon:yes gene_type:complete